jgi:RNA-directed DNA polymerase
MREQIALVLAPLGLRFSTAKTRIVHMSAGFDFLGFRIQWKRKRGSNKWYVYTFIADRPFRSVKAKIRALTPRTSQQDLRAVLIRINQITRGWTNYFKHAIAQRIFSHLQHHTWWRIVRMMRTRHRWKWTDIRRWLTDHTGRWRPISADGIELFNPETIPITLGINLPGKADTNRAILQAVATIRGWRPELRLDDALAALTVPTLFVRGEHDSLCPPNIARELTTRMPDVHITVIPDAGHIPHLDQPQPVATALNQFLSQTSI